MKHAVAYASLMLTKAEGHHSATVEESVAVEKLRPYHQKCHFDIVRDHHAL